MNASAGEARRDLAMGLRVSRQHKIVNHSPGNLINETSIHEFVKQLGFCVIQPPRVTGYHISDTGNAGRHGPQ